MFPQQEATVAIPRLCKDDRKVRAIRCGSTLALCGTSRSPVPPCPLSKAQQGADKILVKNGSIGRQTPAGFLRYMTTDNVLENTNVPFEWLIGSRVHAD